MAIEFVYNNQHNIVTTQIRGALALDEIEFFMENLINSKDIPSDTNILWDIRSMEFGNIDFEFENHVVAFFKKIIDARGAGRSAIVSDYTLGEPLVKMLIILMKDVSENLNSFKTIEEAELWLIS
ncbi:MAG TPA: hypothetical protein ENJ08_11870 [Gammaproteobacteria bacterium]|nr:hypothetical protein [Gammaproteobacteria bacterium]